jgi:hypothetical protein
MGDIVGNPEELQALSSRLAGQHTDAMNSWIDAQNTDVQNSVNYHRSPEADAIRSDIASFTQQTKAKNAELNARLAQLHTLKSHQFRDVGRV